MIFQKNKKNKGFTIIEFIVYFGIFSIMVFSIGTVVFQTINSKIKSEIIQEVGYHAQAVMDKIISSVEAAQTITGPIQGQSAATLTLAMSDEVTNPTIWYTSGGRVYVQKGVTSPVAISSNEVTISNLSFTNVSYPGSPGAVRIQMTIAGSNINGKQEYDYSENFYTTITIRTQ